MAVSGKAARSRDLWGAAVPRRGVAVSRNACGGDGAALPAPLAIQVLPQCTCMAGMGCGLLQALFAYRWVDTSGL